MDAGATHAFNIRCSPPGVHEQVHGYLYCLLGHLPLLPSSHHHHRYFQSGSTDRSPIRRGLIQVAAAKYTAAIMTEMLPTIRNVTPRKGLNEPSHVVVDSTMLFCPSNAKVLYRLVTCTCRHQSSSRRKVRVEEVYDVQRSATAAAVTRVLHSAPLQGGRTSPGKLSRGIERWTRAEALTVDISVVDGLPYLHHSDLQLGLQCPPPRLPFQRQMPYIPDCPHTCTTSPVFSCVLMTPQILRNLGSGANFIHTTNWSSA